MPLDRLPPPHTRNGIYWFNWATTDSGGAACGRDSVGVLRPEQNGDGPPIPDEVRTRIVAEVAECLSRGLWRLAAWVVERARGDVKLRHDVLAQMIESGSMLADGPRLSEADAGHVAACVDVHLLAARVATGARIVMQWRVRGDWADSAEPVTRESPLGVLDLCQRSFNRLDGLAGHGVILRCGWLADKLELWLTGAARPPSGIGPAELGQMMIALERVGLLGPKCTAYLAESRTKRDDFKKRRA
jgi:hypothetical protein